jgi:hypothetical protein
LSGNLFVRETLDDVDLDRLEWGTQGNPNHPQELRFPSGWNRYGACFAVEALRELLLGCLDGHDAVEPGVPRPPILAHAPGSDRVENLVGTEPLTRR